MSGLTPRITVSPIATMPAGLGQIYKKRTPSEKRQEYLLKPLFEIPLPRLGKGDEQHKNFLQERIEAMKIQEIRRQEFIKKHRQEFCD